MLQQTTVAAVTPRFERFIARWPTVETLAAASDADILAEWAGLGYYARARNLIACARDIAKRGGFPTTETGLRALPGVGDYTAAAIAAIAFNERTVVIDANVQRVAARLAGLEQPTRAELRAIVATITPADRPGDFAQAMMDLGATICRPRVPLCGECPLKGDCAAFATGSPDRFPAPKRKTAKPRRQGVAYWIERDGAVWLVRRPAKGLLGGMAALPGSDWTTDSAEISAPVLARVRHVFTHFALELSIVRGEAPPKDGWWQPIGTLPNAGLPTLYRRAAEAVLSSHVDLAA
jgi:A/G-specific adenine glycosylase